MITPIISPSSSFPHQTLQIFSTISLKLSFINKPLSSKFIRSITGLHVSSPTKKPAAAKSTEETIFFDGGAHCSDLVANLLLGLTLVWLPLTLAAVYRAFFLRYRFNNLRVTVISGLSGRDRSDFSYKVSKDVQVVPRFIGEWGGIVVIILKKMVLRWT